MQLLIEFKKKQHYIGLDFGVDSGEKQRTAPSTTMTNSAIELLAGWGGLLPLYPPPAISLNQTAALPQHDCRAMGTTKAPVEGLYILALYSRAGHRVYLGRFEYKRSATAHCSQQCWEHVLFPVATDQGSQFSNCYASSLWQWSLNLYNGFKRCSRQCTHD